MDTTLQQPALLYQHAQMLIQQQRQQMEEALAEAERFLSKQDVDRRTRGLQEKTGSYEDILHTAERLRQDIAQLQSLSDILLQYHQENQTEFRAIEQRDHSSERHQIWLTVVSSVISLILGWFLSLVKSPEIFTGLIHH